MQQESNNGAGNSCAETETAENLEASAPVDYERSAAAVQVTSVNSFDEYDLHPQLTKAIKAMGFEVPTPIQAQTLPFTLKGADIIGQAQTGTGKTAAFLISSIQQMLSSIHDEERFHGEPRLLVLAPTRELVMQIASDAENLCQFTEFNILTLIGGVDYEKQREVLQNEIVDILVATPGRLIDFLRSRDVDLREVEVLVLDEADRMLDMGFISDVRRIVHATPHKPFRQTLFFSATFTEDTNRLAHSWTLYPHEVRIESEQLTADTIEQITYLVTDEEKLKLLYNLLVREDWRKVIVFTNRRDDTRALFEKLEELGLPAAMMSGEIDQRKRIKTIDRFKKGEIQVLVATDVAGRGLHVDDVSQVVNFTLPETPDDYVHRIGRTGRAGQIGTSVNFATEEEAFSIPDIEAHLGMKFRCEYPSEDLLMDLPEGGTPMERRRPSPNRQGHGGHNNNRRRNTRHPRNNRR